MKKVFIGFGMLAFLAYVPVFGQDHQHDQQQAQKETPAQKKPGLTTSDSMKCCEGMEKMGEMKEGMPMKGDMKAKMEKMKEMKEKMSERMKEKGMEGMKMKDMKNDAKPSEPNKDAHQHLCVISGIR